MKKYFALILLLVAVACSGIQKFDSVASTPVERYSIAYKDGKCGVYDNHADSLVTNIEYNHLEYSKYVVNDSIGSTVWICETEDARGLLFVAEETNEFLGFFY